MLANTGVPMIALHLPWMVLLLLPIIGIEFAVARAMRSSLDTKVIPGIIVANLVSTLVGLPLTWGMMLILNIVTTGTTAMGLKTLPALLASVVLQSSWLVPYRDQLPWMIPTATLVLLLPYFFVTVYVERLVLAKLWKSHPRQLVRDFSWKANLTSYGILALCTATWLIVVLLKTKLMA